MALPKGYRNDININVGKTGFPRRQEILDGIANKGTFLPKGVLEEDLDQTFVDFITKDDRINLVIDGKKVPVTFLTIQRWSEFSKTWNSVDKFKNIELPFITIVRKPDIQQGQNQAGLWNIPGNQTYVYYKVPTWDGIREGVDLYKVPQPTSVDVTYEVRLFTNRMKDLNKFNRKIQRAFQSRQCYINPNGHPMPLHLESIGDESKIDDFENRRFYTSLFEMKLLGYILDEEDFEVVPTINRSLVVTELMEDKIYKNVVFQPNVDGNKAVYTFIFNPASEPQFSFTSQYTLNFTQLNEIENITRIIISINGIGIFDGLVLTSPIIINANDIVSIKVYKSFNSTGKFQLLGTA
jgi:hypothetical protein